MNSWPDAGMTPFRNEKNSNWEGAYRVPAMVRWPGRIPAGTVLNGIVSPHGGLAVLVDHDDADREFAYQSEAATFADDEPITTVADRLGWVVVSMRNDWTTVFRDRR